MAKESDRVSSAVSVERSASAKVLYITYDGLTDPLGRSQILPYLTGLADLGHRITLLSCEKPDRLARDGDQLKRLCTQAGISWIPLRYHKHPPIFSSAIDAAAIQRAAQKLQRNIQFDVVHCRSYIAGRAGLVLKERFGTRFLFDMRGFWPDEKVEGRSWNLSNPIYSAVYRYFKRLESRLLIGSDHIVSLTEAGRAQLLTRPELGGQGAAISVIPCCVDFEHFALRSASSREKARGQLGIDRAVPVLAYLGSLGSWYMLEEMLDFFKAYQSRDPRARFLLVTMDDREAIVEAAIDRGIDPGSLIIRPASREEVPGLLSAADLGIFFIKPVFSKTASSPTKMGEMLAIGLPLITNGGVGDVEALVRELRCGVAIQQFTPTSYSAALDQLGEFSGDGEGRREAARSIFDVKLGIDRYDKIYRSLIS